MKLTITLADSAIQDKRGTVSALCLGITRLKVERQPGRFKAGIFLIVDPEAGDAQGERQFELQLSVPGTEPQTFATGAFQLGAPRDQLVMTVPFEMLVPGAGEYVFRFKCAESLAETHLVVSVGEGTTESGEGTPS